MNHSDVLPYSIIFIAMTSYWAHWRLNSPVSRSFTQPFIQGADQRKHESSASLAFVLGIHRWPVDSPHKGPVTRKMFPFDDVITSQHRCSWNLSPWKTRSRLSHIVDSTYYGSNYEKQGSTGPNNTEICIIFFMKSPLAHADGKFHQNRNWSQTPPPYHRLITSDTNQIPTIMHIG